MINSFKKALTTAASILMLASFGISVSPLINSNVVEAAKHHHKKHHHKKHQKHTTKKNSFDKVQKVGNWYVHNAPSLYSQFDNHGTFGQGQRNGSGNPVLRLDLYKDKLYRQGWIIAYANGLNMNVTPDISNGGTVITYGQANQIYERGVKLIETQHPNYNPKLNLGTGTWTTDYQRSIKDDNNN